ncbi:methionine biosynthesis PLP-dependent protein [Bacillus pumilus]|uniref:methionine biosynthesis PLP-dependent protein n=1 Tax=Bacillus pumilus TaxID=1408 RepID=UPI0010BF0FDD|nr:methionine biosynthesis PLP-dependent protein [Bacillus pumilus]TKI24752.1 methionine biosynthesis PLP-dependent protein [Bacillus pumilus]
MTEHVETTLAQIGNRSEEATGTVSPPVYLSTAYRHRGIGESTGFDYIRTKNPTRQLVEDAIASLEEGTAGFAFSSGMAAIQTIMALFESGDELIVSSDLYGGTYRLFENEWKKYGLRFLYDDFSDEDCLRSKITPNTKAIFIETPTNPLMQEADIQKIAKVAKEHGALVIVDNTFYTPVLQKPITLGADIVIHSATKYLGGHNDVLAGLVVTKGEKLSEDMFQHQNAIGAVLSPFDSWLLMRGMKTLALRMRQHEANAKELAQFLKKQPEIQDVLYPGKGGMLSFRVAEEDWVNPFLKQLKTICFAESLGGVESFITYPATQTHMDIPAEIRIANGVCNKLLRFSVGIEHVDDLKADLKQALSQVKEEVHAK